MGLFFILDPLWSQESADQLLEKAESAYVSGDFNRALVFYDTFLSRYASHDKADDVLYWRARILLIMDRFQEAQQTFHQAMDQARSSSVKEESQLGYADSLYYVGELEAALSEYGSLLNGRDSIHAPYLLYQIGTIWKGRGDLEKADSFFEELVQNYPDSYEAHQVVETSSLRSGGLYSIQVGVFHVYANIEKLIPKIESLQYRCQVEEIRTASGKAYRVKVQGFRQDEEARKAIAEIEKLTHLRGRVVRE